MVTLDLFPKLPSRKHNFVLRFLVDEAEGEIWPSKLIQFFEWLDCERMTRLLSFSSPEPLSLIFNRSVAQDATENTIFFIG